MSQKPDVALFIQQAGVVSLVHGTGAILAGVSDIAIHDGLAVEYHLDVITLSNDFLTVPLSHRTLKTAFGRDHTVNGTMILIGLQPLVHISRIIQDLQFHALIGGIPL